jgi:hypothetical protein
MNSGASGYFLTLSSPVMFSTVENPRRKMRSNRGESEMRNVLIAAVAGFASFAAPAFAGQCPPDKMMTDATKPNSTPAIGVTDTVLAAIHVTAHWWKNTGKETAVLLSADLLHDANDHNM